MKHIVTIALLFVGGLLFGQELIRNYDVQVDVQKDRSIVVTEVITVNVEGVNIKRGIFRDIRDVLEDEDGKQYRYTINVQEVTRDGKTEPYTTSFDGYTKQIRIGSPNVLLNNGEHTYKIVYEMRGQVRLFDEFDELYWNAIGNFWQFEIEKASVLVNLPSEAIIGELNAYSGSYGSTNECNCSSEKLNDHTATFKVSEKLRARQGFTVSVTWNKGLFAAPTPEELSNDRVLLESRVDIDDESRQGVGPFAVYILYGGLLIVFLFYYLTWKRVGVDPKKGAIVPRWEVPEDLPPGPLRYIHRMGYDNKVFASSIINLAIKRHIDITEEDKKFTLTQIEHADAKELSQDESVILTHLFSGGSKSIKVEQKNHKVFGKALSEYRKVVKKTYKKPNFTNNYGWLFPGILLSFVTLFGSTSQIYDQKLPVLAILLVLFSAFFIGIFITKNRGARVMLAIFSAVMLFPIIIIFFLQDDFDMSLAYPFIPGLIALGGLNFLFGYLLPAPTIAGRKRMDDIEGLRMYMKTAEQNRLNLMNPPKEDLKLFEQLFPYALALGVQQKWSERFKNMLEAMEYRPEWYHGSFHHAHMGAFATTLGSSFASSVSAASTAPSSSGSSGSGGGGFSGGGGGGGGGGGW